MIPRLVHQPGQDLLEHLVRLRADDGIPVVENLHRHAHDTPRMSLGNLFFDGRSIRAGLNCALAPVRDGPLYGADFQAQVPPLRQRVGELLRAGQQVAHPTTAATCTKILEVEACLWAFVDHPIQASNLANNGPGRPLRRAALWHRRSFGKRSEAGGRFVERILTSVAALHQQHRDVLDYLTDACAAANRHSRAPSLLPEGFCFCSSNVVNSKALGKVIPNS